MVGTSSLRLPPIKRVFLRSGKQKAPPRASGIYRAGRRVREWQGLTLIAQRPQRRGEQHRAWASIVGIMRHKAVDRDRAR